MLSFLEKQSHTASDLFRSEDSTFLEDILDILELSWPINYTLQTVHGRGPY